MKARFFALAALVLGLASCQNDFDGANVSVGGEVDFQLAVAAPELGATRADNDGQNGYDSAFGAIDYLSEADWANVDLRYSLEVYDYNPETKTIGDAPVKDRMVKVLDKYEPVVFELRLVPNRHYHFVVFADFVEQGSTETPTVEAQATIGKHHIIGTTLAEITLNADAINNELTDAYFATKDIEIKNSAAQDMELKRPYGKVRVVATDLAELNLNVKATSVKVEYTAPNANAFNAVYGTISGEGATTFEATYNVATDTFSEYTVGYDDDTTTALNGTVRKSHMTLSTDYILAVDEQKPIHFSVEVFDQNNQPIKKTVFSTDIPVQRNYLTTVIGNVLTSGTEINVTIDDDFAGEKNWPETNEEELAYAAMFGGEVTLTEDITLDEPLTIVADAKVVINLNGKTISGAFAKGSGAIIENNGILTIVGGTLENTTENGDAVINNTGELVLEDVNIEGAPIGTTGYPNYAVYTSGKLIVNDGTQITSDRGVLYMSGSADVTINGGEFVVTDNVGTRVLTAHVIYAYSYSSKLTINDGNFKMNIANGGGTSVICPAGATIKVYGGNFYHVPVTDVQSGCFQNYMGYGAPVDVYGGVFNDNTVTKSGNLAEGYKAVEIKGGYMVVSEDVNGVASEAIENQAGVTYTGEFFENPINDALYFNNWYMTGDATIKVVDKTYGAIILENVSGDINGDVIYIDNDNNSVMVLENCDFTLVEGKKLIKSVNTIYQVFMANITINGVKLTNENAGQYLENVGWFQVVEEI